MAGKLIVNDVTVDAARRAVLSASDLVDLRPLYGLEWPQSLRLRRARDSAGNYASGALAFVVYDLMRAAEQLDQIAREFRELEHQATPPELEHQARPPAGGATGRRPV